MISVSELVPLAVLCAWPALSIWALFQLRKRNLQGRLEALWALVILFPYLGPIAFWILNLHNE